MRPIFMGESTFFFFFFFFFLFFFFAKHVFVGHLFRNVHPSITIYLSLSFTLLYIIRVLQGFSYLTHEAERNLVLHIIINCIIISAYRTNNIQFEVGLASICVCVWGGGEGDGRINPFL